MQACGSGRTGCSRLVTIELPGIARFHSLYLIGFESALLVVGHGVPSIGTTQLPGAVLV